MAILCLGSRGAWRGRITIMGGTGDHRFSGDGGPATDAAFHTITDIEFDRQGIIYGVPTAITASG